MEKFKNSKFPFLSDLYIFYSSLIIALAKLNY